MICMYYFLCKSSHIFSLCVCIVFSNIDTRSGKIYFKIVEKLLIFVLPQIVKGGLKALHMFCLPMKKQHKL